MVTSKFIYFFSVFATLFAFSFSGISQEKGNFDLILDTDMAIDDWPAVLYVLNQRKRANLLGITVPGTGESHCKVVIKNILELIHLAGREKENIQVSCGDEVPMEGVHAFPDSWRNDVDSFYGIDIPNSPQKMPGKIHSVDHLVQMLQKAKGKVVVLTLGPLTNFGQLLQGKHRKLAKKKIKRIYVMGGAIVGGKAKSSGHGHKVKGNVIVPGFTEGHIKNKVAEWNIWIDPVSAQITFRSGIPITMVGLNGTNEVQVTRKFAADFKKRAKSKGAKFTDKILDKNGWFIDSKEYFFWDPLTAVAVFEPVCQIETKKVDVNVEVQKGITAEQQLAGFVKSFAKGAKDQYKDSGTLGKKALGKRKALNEMKSGETFVSSKPGVKNVEVCMHVSPGEKSKGKVEGFDQMGTEDFKNHYMHFLNKY
jgi:pyrimidine-specific ribonucleoside hydrolase